MYTSAYIQLIKKVFDQIYHKIRVKPEDSILSVAVTCTNNQAFTREQVKVVRHKLKDANVP